MSRRSSTLKYFLPAILVVAAVFILPRAYEMFRASIASQHAKRSEGLLGNGEVEKALDKLEAAHKLDPGNLKISRQLAETLKKHNPQTALSQYKEIVQSPEATSVDKLEFAKVALEAGDIATAETQLQLVDPLGLGDRKFEYHLVSAKVYDALGNSGEAIRQTRVILVEEESEFHNPARFLFARIAIKGGNPILLKEAKDILDNMTRSPGQDGIEAIRFYFGVRGFSKEEALSLFLKTFKHPLATAQDKLDAASLYHKANPGETVQIIESLKTEFDLSGVKPEELHKFCYWLAGIREWEAILELLSKETALQTSQLYTLRLDALNNLSQWQRLAEETDEPTAPVPPHFRLAFRSRALNRLEDKEGALRQIDHILESVKEDRDALVKTCEYLEKTKEYESLLHLLDKAVKTIPALEPYACTKRIRHLLPTASLDELCSWYHTIQEKSTNLADIRTRKTYFDLLADKNLGESILNAKSLYAADPQDLETRVVMALAQYKSGDFQKSQHTLDYTQSASWKNSTIGWKMLYAHILRKNGKAEQADALILNVPTAKLSRAEREGFDNL